MCIRDRLPTAYWQLVAQEIKAIFPDESVDTYYVPASTVLEKVFDKKTRRPKIDPKTKTQVVIKRKKSARGKLVNHYEFKYKKRSRSPSAERGAGDHSSNVLTDSNKLLGK